jgi:hypothetical protein
MIYIIVFIIAIIVVLIYYMQFTFNSYEIDKNKCYMPIFNKEFWNSYFIQPFNNCYSYAIMKPELNRFSKLYVGELSGMPHMKYDIEDNYTCLAFDKRLKKDFPNIQESTIYNKCPCNTYKIGLFLDNTTEKKDFHFYREDIDHTWSHKPGGNEATNVDASNNIITNPLTADRNYSKKDGFNYNVPCNFYCINSIYKF